MRSAAALSLLTL